MRLVFVTPRFRAGDATAPELLAAELAGRSPGGWRTTVVTTTAAGASEDPFRAGDIQDDGVRVVRFPAEAQPGPEPDGRAGAASLTSPELLAHLRDRVGDYDLLVLFGSSAVCLEAAKLDPGRAVLLPFADMETDAAAEIYRHPAAFVFGSEAEEILFLKRYQVHRRMRETVAGTLLLPRGADPAAFRRRAGLTGPYLVSGGPLESGRGIEELLRFFSTFKDRHPQSALELVLIGPAAMPVPKHADIRVVDPANTRERLDAVGGATLAVIPERLAAFSTTAAEPFSLGIPILVNASATELAEECRASGGGLYYQNYDEFELILELGLRDASLFPRMGAAGRAFLESRHDWDLVMARYDRAFRSFARPSRSAAGEAAPAEAALPRAAEKPVPLPPDPELELETTAVAAPGDDAAETEGDGARDVSEAPGDPLPAAEAPPESEDEPPAELSGESAPPDVSDEVSGVEAEPEVLAEAEAAEKSGDGDVAAPDDDPGSTGPGDAEEPEQAESGADDGLPSFFRSSIRS